MASTNSLADGTTAPADGTSTNTVQPSSPTSTSVTAVGPNDIPITLQYVNDNAWPKDFKLDLELNNWDEWSFQVTLLAGRQGFSKYLNGTFAQPAIDTHPKAHHIWASNDDSLKHFLFSHISRADYRTTSTLPSAYRVFEELRKTHEKQGLHAQMILIQKALEIQSSPDKLLLKTADEIDTLHTRIVNMGPITFDDLRAIFLLNCLSDSHDTIRSHLLNIAEEPSFSSKSIIRRFAQEDSHSRRRNDVNPVASTALAAQTQGRPRSVCTNCKKPGHGVDFCVQPGGKMAGRSIDDARTAQHAASGKPPRVETRPSGTFSATAKIATSDMNPPSVAGSTPAPATSVVIGGVTYHPALPVQPSTACVAYVQQARIETVNSASDDSHDQGPYSYHSYLALGGPVSASVDWSAHATLSESSDNDISPVLSQHARALLSRSTDCPFILDSGASHHISPERSDFRTLRPITPHPIQGFNGSSTSAIGIGDIDLCIASGHKLMLKDVLFVPSCNTCLVSVSALTQTGYNFVTFGHADCWLSDKHGKVIVRGCKSTASGLYTLNCSTARVTHTKLSSGLSSPSAHYVKRVPDLETWHRRLGHCSNRTIIDMARRKVVKGMAVDLSSSPPVCDSCILGKQTRSPVPKVWEGVKATMPLERVHVDLCGPMPVASRSGHVYSMNVIDNHSSYMWSLPLRNKSEASSILQGWHRAVKNQSGHKLKVLVTDNGELVSKSMTDWCTTHGIDHQLTAPYTSAHNGRAERLHRTLLGRARSMRLACNAPASLWDEFCATAAYLTNLTASSSLQGRMPHELWYGKTPSLSHLREIGCRTFALIQTNNPKIYRRSTPCTLIGYAPHSKAYRLWDNTTRKILNSFHVTFIEHLDSLPADLLPGTKLLHDPDAPPTWDTPSPNQNSLPSPPPSNSPPFIPTSSPFIPIDHFPSNQTATSSTSHIHQSPVDPLPPPQPVPDPPAPHRSQRIAARSQTPARALLAEFSKVSHSHELLPLAVPDLSLSPEFVLSAIADGSMEPSIDTGDDPSWADALTSPDREYWIAGAREEIQSLKDLRVYVLIPRFSLPPGRRPMRGKLVCKRKRDDSGAIARYKVRYVAKGYAQQYGVDYDKTTAPTARLESFRIVLHLAVSLGWDLQQYDIKTAFLHGVLPPEETAYMEQPPGFEESGKEGWVMQLNKSIYGMKQASRIWNRTFHKTVTGWGFERMKNEWCVYRRISDTGTTIFALHVDDIIAASSSIAETNRFKTDLKSAWEISDLGPAKFALGIAITRDLPNKTISISQSAFIDRILDKFRQTDSHPCQTLMVAGLNLIRPNKSQPVAPHITEWMQRTPYRELVGSLNYLAVATRPDIAFAVGRLASFLDCYREEHWNAAIRVLRYVKGTRTLCLTLGGDHPLNLFSYADSDYANDPDTSRSISGYCYSLGAGMISWSSKKQRITADSSCYSEYIALHHAGKELIFLRELLEGLDHPSFTSTPLHCDNDAACLLTGDHSNHGNVKHIRVKYHTIHDIVDEGLSHIIRISTHDNVADIFTKSLAKDSFERFRDGLGLRFG
jgi:transposase InsO family protein